MGLVPFNDLARYTSMRMAAALALLEAVLTRGTLILGPEVEAFEAEFAASTGMPHAVAVGNGTDALELALRALGIGAGDGVICAANAGGYVRTACNAIGARAQYADIEAEGTALDLSAAAARIDQTSRAIVVTHLYGRVARAREFAALARAHGLKLIEDCAQAHGAHVDGQPVGSFGDAGCYSFYPTKNLAALGDGGAVVVRDPEVAQRMGALRQYGWRDKYQVHVDHGRNSRLDAFQAAWLRAELPLLAARNARRRALADRYQQALAGHPRIQTTPLRNGDVVHLYSVRCAEREALQTHLNAAGIATAVHYPTPDHRQPAWLDTSLSLPNTDALAAQTLSLPCFPELRDDELKRVVEALRGFNSPRNSIRRDGDKSH